MASKVCAARVLVAHSYRASVRQGSGWSKMGLNALSNKDVNRIQVDVCETAAVLTSRRVSAAVVSVVVNVIRVRSWFDFSNSGLLFEPKRGDVQPTNTSKQQETVKHALKVGWSPFCTGRGGPNMINTSVTSHKRAIENQTRSVRFSSMFMILLSDVNAKNQTMHATAVVVVFM